MANGGVADLVLTGAPVYTLDAARRWADAVAIADGRIVAVGLERDVHELIGPATEVRRLPGGSVLPGFQDAHVHPAFGGRNLLRVHLDHLATVEAYLGEVAGYANLHPDEPWITGGGWAMHLFPGGKPRREDLDRIVPDRPVFLMNRDVHGAWVNSRALELAGITRDTPDPWDGHIDRDPASGDPTGALDEGAAYAFRDRFVPATQSGEWRDSLLVAQRHLHALGITGWQDAWVEPDLLQAYLALHDANELTMRVSTALWWDRYRGLEQVDELIERGRSATRDGVRAMVVKIMVDGVIENCTCALLRPYDDPDGYPPGHLGLSYVDAETLHEAVTRLDASGFQVHMHAIGDRAVRDALDAVAAAQSVNGWSDRRHHIAHLQVVHPDDVTRFRALGVVANIQPLWACSDPQMIELTLPRLGAERISWQYPFGDLARSGAMLAGGSDWPVSSPDPLREMEVAIRRTEPGASDEEPFLPEQRLSLPQALAAFTIGSAYVNHDEREAGSIEVGKRADLAVLDRNPFDTNAGPLGEAKVVLTIAAGRVVHET